MATQLLIYERAVPVSRARHADCSVEVGADYSFTRNVNSVPLMAVEFPHAASEYPMVFAGIGATVMPAVILGVRGQENLFLGGANEWKAQYIPAFVRRYPFVFSTAEDNSSFTLCIDEAYAGFNRTGRGARLFEDDGQPSAYVQQVLKFLQEYQAQFKRTQAFCSKLKELNLLDPMQAELTLPSGERTSLTGFTTVSRDRLKQLPGDKLAGLAQTDELELVYLHLHSMRNFNALPGKIGARGAASKPTEPSA